MKRLIIGLAIVAGTVVAGLYVAERNQLVSVTLTSPHNTAMYNQVEVVLKKPAPV